MFNNLSRKNEDFAKKVTPGLATSPYAAHMKCLNLAEEKKTVLDVGCASGYLSCELKKKGCYVVGLEKGAELAKEAQRYCDKVFVGDAETIELPYKCYFDVILLADVLAYFRNPKEALIKFKNYLKKNGYIVISVPNMANWSVRLSLLFGNFNYREKGILANGYLRFFTTKTIKETLRQAGFKIESFDITTNLKGSTRFGFVRFLAGLRKNLFAVQFIIKAVISRN